MTSNKAYSNYFIKDSRGYNFIRSFYERYKDELHSIAYNSFDSLLNHISLIVNIIELPKATRNEEVYIAGLIKVQCRTLLDQMLKLRNPESEPGSPQEGKAGNNFSKTRDVFKRITEFKLQLDSRELSIFNSTIDGESREDLNEEGINTESYESTVKRLKTRFSIYLKELGYNYNSFFPEQKIESPGENT
ncbi:MAG TPA: hypothetical protein VMT35_02040 [Ignavibacteriaceae bacterium]|nr:hypothetical protein [Ignavibacteriaceae bacterium]